MIPFARPKNVTAYFINAVSPFMYCIFTGKMSSAGLPSEKEIFREQLRLEFTRCHVASREFELCDQLLAHTFRTLTAKRSLLPASFSYCGRRLFMLKDLLGHASVHSLSLLILSRSFENLKALGKLNDVEMPEKSSQKRVLLHDHHNCKLYLIFS